MQTALRESPDACRLAYFLAGHAASVAQQRGISVDVDVDVTAELPQEVTRYLSHALCSVIDNAIEHAFARRSANKPEAGRLRITTACHAPGEVSLDIEDDGTGIDLSEVHSRCIEQGLEARTPTELVAALFEPGVSSRLRPLQMLIARFGGRCEVRSERGIGCRFRFTFPLG